MSKTLNFWSLKINVIFLLSIKNEIQLINHLKTFFLFMIWVSCSCSILKNISNILNNNNVVMLFFFFHTVQIWLSRNVSMISVNLFWWVFIYCDKSMSCFFIMLWNQIIIIIFIILFMIFSNTMNFQKLNSW